MRMLARKTDCIKPMLTTVAWETLCAWMNESCEVQANFQIVQVCHLRRDAVTFMSTAKSEITKPGWGLILIVATH